MEATSSPENSAPVRDESFYLDEDPMAIFLIENRLFRVHRHFLVQGSEIFRDMFSQAGMCEGAATAVEGMSEDKPIVLSQVTVKEFKALSRFFYAMVTQPIPNKKALADILAFEQDEKVALLSIAHQFVFDKIFEYICGELEPGDIPLVDRVRLGDKYCLKAWLSSAYKTILERAPNQKLSQEELNVLGTERTVRILEEKNLLLHEAYQVGRQETSDNYVHCPSCNNRRPRQVCNSCGEYYCSRDDARGPPAATITAIAQAAERLVQL